MKGKITKRAVDALQPGEFIADLEVRGFMARRLPSGVVTYGFQYRAQDGRRPWISLGLHGSISPDRARDLARKRSGEVASDRDPAAERQAGRMARTTTINGILDAFIDRYVHKQRLRSAGLIESAFHRLVRPRIGSKSIYALTRRDMVELLDAIEDDSGPAMADSTLAYVRKAFSWWATRDDKFNTPIVRGMSRTRPRERARNRILDDEEVRDLWSALDQFGEAPPACYPGFVRASLLTGQRRSNVAQMHSDEIKSGNWTIPAERMKGKRAHLVPLSAAVKAMIGQRKGFLFSTDGGETPFSGYSKSKAALDRKLAELHKRGGRKPMPAWSHHDLRRTARSILSRYATPDIAERVLGHTIPGVRGVYDLYEYESEKRAALEALAAHVERAVQPGSEVVPFPKRAR